MYPFTFKHKLQGHKGNQDYLLWEYGTRLKVIAPSSKYSGMVGVFMGCTSSKKSIFDQILLNVGIASERMKAVSVYIKNIQINV